jgi:hypothetical protein
MKRAALCALFLSGCAGSGTIDLHLLSDASVSDAAHARVTTLSFDTSGAQIAHVSASLSRALARDERVRLVSLPTSGAITLTVHALESDSSAVASGQTSIALQAGEVAAELTLSASTSNPGDMAGVTDLRPVDLSSADLAGVDLLGNTFAFPVVSPVTLADATTVASASGSAQQRKIVWAATSQQWWLFYIDGDTTKLKSRYSTGSSFTAWNDGAALTLPVTNSGEGRNFSVTTLAPAGLDVLHLAVSLHTSDFATSNFYGVRSTIASNAITWGSPLLISSMPSTATNCPWDGPTVTVTADGYLDYTTGWWTTSTGPLAGTWCDGDIFRSSIADAGGASWSATFPSMPQYMATAGGSHAHQVVALSGSDALLGWDAPDKANVYFGYSTAGSSWVGGNSSSPEDILFGQSGSNDLNDWSLCALGPSDAHAVRRTGTSTFEHARWNAGTHAWIAGDSMPADNGQPGTGVVLLTNGSRMAAFAIASDNSRSVRYTTWVAGAGWAQWQTLVGNAADRSFLSGSGCEATAHQVLLWTENQSGDHKVVGAPLTF